MLRRRILVLFVLLAVLCVGCGKQPAEPEQTRPPTTTDATETTPQMTQPPEEETGELTVPNPGNNYGWSEDVEYEYCIYNLSDGLYEVLLERGANIVRFWYDQEEQMLFASVALPEEIPEDWLSDGQVTLSDMDGDGNDDVLVSLITAQGVEHSYCFLWDTEKLDLQQEPSAQYSTVRLIE